ncbi:hypothetical protein [Natronoglycomyces albus]|uniref:Lipoprotein n=1 Tax=Natronoglycomyces albus TaxID=2811108 RepID=A0A895XWJ9_9ACTN|nr:hypothetical protein [Natronoglycomyces albus]QSB06008.1 hypothetical protein JQS30_03535 [Natronoglycomyces albus]
MPRTKIAWLLAAAALLTTASCNSDSGESESPDLDIAIDDGLSWQEEILSEGPATLADYEEAFAHVESCMDSKGHGVLFKGMDAETSREMTVVLLREPGTSTHETEERDNAFSECSAAYMDKIADSYIENTPREMAEDYREELDACLANSDLSGTVDVRETDDIEQLRADIDDEHIRIFDDCRSKAISAVDEVRDQELLEAYLEEQS